MKGGENIQNLQDKGGENIIKMQEAPPLTHLELKWRVYNKLVAKI